MVIEFSNNWFAERTKPIWEKQLVGLPVETYLEIGVCEGQSMRWILEQFKPKHAVGVDAWVDAKEKNHEAYEVYRQNCLKNLDSWIKDGTVDIVHSYAQDFFADYRHEYKGHFDLAYIDGGHDASDAMADMMMAYEMLKPPYRRMQLSTVDRKGRLNIETKVGGVMVVDDCHRWWNFGKPLVQIAVHAFEQVMHTRVKRIWEDGRQIAFIRLA